MRVMASLGLCVTPTPEVYVANEKTVVMTQPIGRDGIPCMYVGDGGLDPCISFRRYSLTIRLVMILPFRR